MDLGLAGRVYVLTGASTGLGYATAVALVADGARVVLSARSAGALDAAVERLGDGSAAGPAVGSTAGVVAGSAVGVVADLADPDAPERLVAAARDTFGRLDGALVSVGGPPRGGSTDNTDTEWRDAFESVFLGAVRMLRTVVPALAGNEPGAGGERGAVALVLSTSVKQPIGGLAISNGLRPGLGMLASTYAEEWGPRGVRVVGLLPGTFATGRGLPVDTAQERERRGAGVPLRRIGEPAEFGRVAAFVLSPAASYVTGTMIAVDGGILRSL